MFPNAASWLPVDSPRASNPVSKPGQLPLLLSPGSPPPLASPGSEAGPPRLQASNSAWRGPGSAPSLLPGKQVTKSLLCCEGALESGPSSHRPSLFPPFQGEITITVDDSPPAFLTHLLCYFQTDLSYANHDTLMLQIRPDVPMPCVRASV